jgi:2-polyprenyl-3-methyl-5-hydroxy-6-metoxy-1,4-benzoquinol methylase
MSKIKGSFAGTYDRFVSRASMLPEGLQELIKSIGSDDILEFGCGTGTVAVGLSLAGYNVTGIDHSPDMLKIAREKAKSSRAELKFIKGDIIDIDLGREFGLILCLGNTVPLMTGLNDCRRFFKNCVRHLKPGGTMIIQILNYDRILKYRPATFATDVLGDIIRVKQYRYGKSLIEFVVSLIDNTKIPPEIAVSRRKIRPWKRADLSRELRDAGFKKVAAYGDYLKSRFSLKSKDLVVVARI